MGRGGHRHRGGPRRRQANAEELINLVKARKGSAHAPKHIKFVRELPMTGVGKVDKKVLKAGFWAGRDRMVG
jgi:fatty-acyl-CoA synthase